MSMFHHNFRAAPKLIAALGLALAVCLSGCASKPPLATSGEKSFAANSGVQKIEKRNFLGVFSPYRPDIQQGNFISQEMMAQLKEGMTQEQVRFLLGTPLLTDIFHADRWDYSFRLQKGTGEVLASRVTVFFKDSRVSRFEGGNLPSEKDFLSLIAGEAEPQPASAK